MDEPRTHYQVSFTSRQGLAVFVALVAAIGLAYFLGLMTGLAGSDARQLATATPASVQPLSTAAPSITEPPFPAPVLGVGGRAAAARPTVASVERPTETPGPVPTPSIQLFEDRASSEPTRPPPTAGKPGKSVKSAKPTPAPASAPGKTVAPAGFWVQVDSLSSKDQAEARRRHIAAAGFKATVFPGTGPRGAIFRVRIGPYATREEAERARDAVARKAKIAHPWVVPPGQ